MFLPVCIVIFHLSWGSSVHAAETISALPEDVSYLELDPDGNSYGTRFVDGSLVVRKFDRSARQVYEVNLQLEQSQLNGVLASTVDVTGNLYLALRARNFSITPDSFRIATSPPSPLAVLVVKIDPVGKIVFRGGLEEDLGLMKISAGPRGAIFMSSPNTPQRIPLSRVAGYPQLARGSGFLALISANGEAVEFLGYATREGDMAVEAIQALPDSGVLIGGTAPQRIEETVWLGDRDSSRAMRFASADSGASWSIVAMRSASEGPGFGGILTVDPEKPEVVYEAGGSLKRSTDGGQTWQTLLEPIRSASWLVIAPSKRERLYLVEADQLRISNDAGETWRTTRCECGLLFSLAVNPRDPDVLFAGTRFGLRRSADGGATWEQVGSGQQFDSMTPVFHPSDPLRIVGLSRAFFSRSTDGGKTWTGPPILLRNVPSDIVFDPATPGVYFALTSEARPTPGLVMSSDDGATWLRVGIRLRPGRLFATYFPTFTLFVTNAEGLFRSTDRGKTWARISPEGYPFADWMAVSHDSSRIYMNTYRKTDIAVRRIGPGLDSVLFTSAFGGFGPDTLVALGLDENGRVIATGSTAARDLRSGPSGDRSSDGYAVAISADGQRLESATVHGTAERDVAQRAFIDASGGVLLAGIADQNYEPAPDPQPPTDRLGDSDTWFNYFEPSGAVRIGGILGTLSDIRIISIARSTEGILILGQSSSSNFRGAGSAFLIQVDVP